MRLKVTDMEPDQKSGSCVLARQEASPFKKESGETRERLTVEVQVPYPPKLQHG